MAFSPRLIASTRCGKSLPSDFGEFEIVAEFFSLLVSDFRFRTHELAGVLDDFSEPVAQLGPFAEILGQNMADAQKHFGGRGQLLIGIDEIGGPRVQIGGSRIGGQNFLSQRLELALPGERGQRLLLWLKRKIQIFQPLDAVGSLDRTG